MMGAFNLPFHLESDGSTFFAGPLVAPVVNSPSSRMPNRMTYVGATNGVYVDNNGNISPLGGFGLTDFIEIPETTVRKMISSNDALEYLNQQGGFYDSSKTFMSGIVENAVYPTSPVFNIPVGAKYIRAVYRIGTPLYIGFAEDRVNNPITLSILGDSIMTLWGLNETSIPQLIQDRMYLGSVQNLAAGGLALSGANGIASRCSQVSEFSSHVLVEGGVNDWINGLPIGTITDSTLSTFYGACNIIADFFRNKRPYQKLVWMTPFRSRYHDVTNPIPLSEYAAAIQAVGVAKGIPVVDAFNDLPINFESANGAQLYSWDALHGNDVGISIITDYCIDSLNQ